MKKLFAILLLIVSSISSYSQNENVPAEVEFKSYLSQANIFILKGDNSKAASCLMKCINLNPKSSTANFQLARIYFELNDLDAALNFGSKAYQLKPDNYWYTYFLALVYERLGDFNNAVKFYDLSFPKNPTPQDFVDQFNLYFRFRNFESALSTLKNFENYYGYSPSVGLRRAQVFEAKKDLKSAENEFFRVIAVDSSDFNLYAPLIEFYINNNKLAEAQKLQDRISQKNSNFPLGQLSQALICRESGRMDCFYQNLVEFFGNDRNMSYDQKMEVLQDLLLEQKNPDVNAFSKIFESFSNNYPDEVKIHSLYSSFLMSVNHFDEAALQLKKCLEIDKSDFQYYSKLFRVYLITEDYPKMKATADEAAEFYPDQSEVYLFSGIADTYLGRYDDAESNFQMAQDFGIELSNAYNYYNFYEGVLSYFTNYKELALAYFDKYLNSHDDNYYLLVQLAYFLIDHGKDLRTAESIIKQCSDYPYLNYFFYFTSAFLDLKTNRLDRAVSNIEKSLSLNDQKYYVLNMAGDIYQLSGNCEKAVFMWNKAIDRGGNAQLLQKKITNCK